MLFSLSQKMNNEKRMLKFEKFLNADLETKTNMSSINHLHFGQFLSPNRNIRVVCFLHRLHNRIRDQDIVLIVYLYRGIYFERGKLDDVSECQYHKM